MTRVLVLCGLLAAAAAPAPAQQLMLSTAAGDTAIGASAASTTHAGVRFLNYFGVSINQLRVVVRYDSTKLVVGVDTPTFGLTSVDFRAAPGHDTIIATGSIFASTSEILSLRLQQRGGASGGTWLWLETDALLTSSGDYTSQAEGIIAQVCEAFEIYGDVDAGGDVDSRDALITLSAAVGLPVTGFTLLPNGDVDNDGLANSRDALMMLTAAIGYSTAGTRAGGGIPVNCPGLAPAPDGIVFTPQVAGGLDSLMYIAPGQNNAVLLDTNVLVRAPRLADNGTDVLYVCYDPTFYQQVCRIRTDGGGLAVRSPPFQHFYEADWAPGSQRIAYRHQSSLLYVSDSSGANVSTFSIIGGGQALTWRRNGTELVYDNCCSNTGLQLVNDSGTVTTPITTGATDAVDPRLDPGDSLVAFRTSGRRGVFAVTVAGGALRRVTAIADISSHDWGTAGVLFTTTQALHPGIWLLPASGSAPLQRITAAAAISASLRRAP